MEFCDELLRQARQLPPGSGDGADGSSGGGDSEAAWLRRAAASARRALRQLVRLDGAVTVGQLRSAAAAAGRQEILRALDGDDDADEDEARGQAAAATANAAAPAGSGSMARTACAACGAADAPLRCSACRGARYCGAECQKRDWRAHKAACKQRRQEMAAAAGAAPAGGEQQQ